MLYGKYLINCVFETEAILPRIKGSTIRGVFGIALKRVVCALRHLECSECLLAARCLYARTFEKGSLARKERKASQTASPNPFVLEPPLTLQTHYYPGSPFSFHLLLFGEENKNLAYFVYALDQMGKIGMGKKINGKRGSYRLESVVSGSEVLYSGSDGVLKLPENLTEVSIDEFMGAGARDCKMLKVEIVSPLRIKYRNRLTRELPFHVLARAMLRRVSSLFEHYGEIKPGFDYRGLVERAARVKTADSNLGWFDWKRYSNRQERSMFMGGMVGSVTYRGELGEFVPFIDFCSKVHLGKQTTFGLGKMRYEILE